MRTIDEFRTARPAPARGNVAQIRVVAQEAVRLQALTGDPAWDHFLSFVEASIKKTEAWRNDKLTRLRDPRFVNPDEVAVCRAEILQMDARIDTLKEILLLPKFLKEQSELAQRQIAEMVRDAS